MSTDRGGIRETTPTRERAGPHASSPAHRSRRRWLFDAGGGLGGIALAHLLARSGLLAGESAPSGATRNALAGGRTSALATLDGGLHHRARARRVIQIFLNGGASQVDTFDPKPRLARDHGKRFDPGSGARVESVTGSGDFRVLKSPFAFRRYGECGRWVSSVFPHIAGIVDRLAFLMSVTSPTNVHGLGSYFMNTGFTIPGFPCMGAWISYGLGTLNEDLPTFVALPDARGLPYNNRGNFTAGFLPARHEGTVIDLGAPSPIPHLAPPPNARGITPRSEADGRRLLRRLNRRFVEEHPGESRLEARIASYELAARLQLAAPELFDLSRESDATRRLYGVDEEPTREFGRRLLLARRMIERGVRFVQVWSGASGPTNNWDNHANIETELPFMTRQVDLPAAGLILDLEARGLLDDTLVIWTTEFGRMPFGQGQSGRDHNGGTFVVWLAGAGVRAGHAIGESDEWGWKAIEPISVHDLHATILWLLGIDHERLTVRHEGRDFRLTDVDGFVLRRILA